MSHVALFISHRTAKPTHTVLDTENYIKSPIARNGNVKATANLGASA